MTSSFFQTLWRKHIDHVRLVLQRLLENRLFAKAEKCEFHRTTVQFLGFIISRGKLEMDPAKTDAVSTWPTPTSRKELQRFLGFANFYRRFIRNFSSIVSPLTKLTSIKIPFHWSTEAEAAFQTLKYRFSSAPILIMPDPEKQFVVEVDASDTGAGAILSQRSPDGKIHPCAYFSRRLSPTERKLRRRRPGITSTETSPRRMETPPRGCYGSVFGMDRSQEPRVPTHS